jgi:hypothetical protein
MKLKGLNLSMFLLTELMQFFILYCQPINFPLQLSTYVLQGCILLFNILIQNFELCNLTFNISMHRSFLSNLEEIDRYQGVRSLS